MIQELVETGLMFHHVGVACHDLDTEESLFSIFGYEREGPDFFDPIQGVYGRFLVGGGPRLELLRNRDEQGVLSPWLRANTKFYHIAYETGDLTASARKLLSDGAREIVAPVPAVAFGMRKIAFYALRNVSLIELISRALD